MDSFDLFKLLRTGAKFDAKRFKNEANRFKVANPQQPLTNAVQTKRKSTADSTAESNVGKKRKKNMNKKTRMIYNAKLSDGNSEDEIELMTSLKKKEVKKELIVEKLIQTKKNQMDAFRKRNSIYCTGADIPDPLETFAQLVADYKMKEEILNNIMRMGYSTPTPIQMQAISVMIHRREILACAPTGSGKTAAFLIPILLHLKEPKSMGFRALIVEPTRELAKQVYAECCQLSEGVGFRIHMIENSKIAKKKFGPKTRRRFDILITTPSRLIHLLREDPPAISLDSVEWLVVDECDKLFEAGPDSFRDQLAVIYKACTSSNIRRALFSATYAYDVEEWCKLTLDNIITVFVGARNSAVETVKQELVFVGSESGKLLAFRQLVRAGLPPPVLIFVQSKERAKELFNELIYDGINVEAIHSDRTQLQRDNVVRAFRTGKIWVLICTELMGRGIDFKGVNLVINYDFPSSAISYIHRIGRSGRAGRQGHAITYFTEDDVVNLKSIAVVIKNAGCPVPEYLLKLKKQSKQKKKQLAKWAPYREQISTIPLYDLEVAEREKRKLQREARIKARDTKEHNTNESLSK